MGSESGAGKSTVCMGILAQLSASVLTKRSDELMADVLASIIDIANDKKVVIIDGVGDPSVGSVVGVSNVDVALSLPCHVIFVGKPGIGAALDNTVLCVSFMQQKGLSNIGIIYNKIPLSAFAEIKKYVTKRLPELLPNVTLLGFIGEEQLVETHSQEYAGEDIARWFTSYIDRKTLLFDWLGLRAMA